MMILRKLWRVPTDTKDYRFAWALSFLIAVLFAPFVMLLKDSAPWFVLVPLTLGSVVFLVCEVQAGSQPAPEEIITADFQGKIIILANITFPQIAVDPDQSGDLNTQVCFEPRETAQSFKPALMAV